MTPTRSGGPPANLKRRNRPPSSSSEWLGISWPDILFPAFMFRSPTIRLLLLTTLLGGLSGCEIGRTWGTMSSDSPAPFLGIDLLPRRRTTQLSFPEGEPAAPSGRSYGEATRPLVNPAADRPPPRRRSLELNLPSLSEVLTGEHEEELSFTGPPSAFSK